MATVLIIEDEANIRKFANVNLSMRGYQVVEAPNATLGIEKIRQISPDLVLLDILLPDMTGWELLETVAADPAIRGVRVVLMTASAFADTVVNSENYNNVAQVLVKPVSANDLVSAVEKNCRGK